MESTSFFQQYQRFKKYVDWSPEDEERIGEIGRWVQADFPAIVADFYQQIRRTEEAFQVIQGGAEQIARLQRTLLNWLEELFRGPYNEAYVERRWRIGYRHVEIGLAQTVVHAAVSRLRSELAKALSRRYPGPEGQLPDYLVSLHRLLDLEAAIIDEAYCAEFTRRDQQTQRLAMLGQVSGGIAHELRNPLNVIKTSVYYLQHAQSASPQKVAEHLDRIERQVNLAGDVITAITEFSKIGTPDFNRLLLSQCLSEWIENHCFSPQVRRQLDVQGTGPISGDPRQLQIVVGNLVRNACEAMSEGGILMVSLREDNERVTLMIEDNGHGIPEDKLSRITEPWFSTKARGAGLGLAITKAILDRHHARLEVSSVVGQGTSFSIVFPRISD